MILLAPMEGLLDHMLRDVLTRVGGIDRCVSEFIRITDMLMPNRVFTRIVPELLNGGLTPAGVPVRAQLLGSDPVCMAENAAKLAALGPAGIDLNFGCPAKCVNRHRGGAVLLDEPELLREIVAAVRRAVPAAVPISAKMRLGYLDASRTLECALALVEGGASELVIHARTKADGYKPPAYWDRIAEVRATVKVPVVANGEIWTAADALNCRAQSGCEDLMLGRGMVANPGLALAIRAPGAAAARLGAAAAPDARFLRPRARPCRAAAPGRPAQAMAALSAPPLPRGRGGLSAPAHGQRSRRTGSAIFWKPTMSLVYSTDAGRICPVCRQPVAQCQCGKKTAPVGDGIVRVARETKGRKGKGVTLVKGLALDEEGLTALAKQLKAACGSGGTVKDWVIEIQGDHIERVMEFLQKAGHRVKRAGG